MKSFNKPYKADTAQGTLNRIKTIISKHSIPVQEQKLGDDKRFYSCRIFLSHDDDSSIGTNGKGMNREYAMASGYAELMERFQNRVIVYPNPASINAPCRFFPDEKPYHWEKSEIIENVRRFVPRVMSSDSLEVDKVDGVSIPFYHVNTATTVQVPYSLIRWVNGSNGMCAGNIREEALIQGFCEIFERYSMQIMYCKEIVPPEVPLSVFEGTEVLERLYELRDNHGMEFSVKDYSLGEGFPVIGLLLFNNDKSKYILHLGADLNPEIALERCYTEVFQGYTAETLKFENDVNDCEKFDTFNEFKRSLMHGRGKQHSKFFTSKPSYSYKGHTTIPIGGSFKEDLHNICNWIIAKGYDIYIRDNSFLGFPSLHIVVPGLSEIDHTFCNLNKRISHMQLTENRMDPLLRLTTLNDAECYETIAYLNRMDKDVINLFARNSHPNNSVNRHLLLMFLYVKVGNRQEAAKCIEAYVKHCKTKGLTVRPYYERMLDIIYGRNIKDITSSDYKIAKAFLDHPEKALHAIDTPKCFDCEKCTLANGCRYTLLKNIEDITQCAMKKYDFDQTLLSNLFI